MRIKRIEANNFKGFNQLSIDLDGRSTVFFGINGTGKSSVLTIINYLFWPWLNRINPSQSVTFRSFDSKLVKHGKTKMEISVDLDIDDKIYSLGKVYQKARPGKATAAYSNKKEYDAFVDYFVNNFIISNNMPIFAFYGTNRSVLDIPLRIRQKHNFSIEASIEKASDNSASFRTFFEWFRNQEDYENEQKLDNPEYEDPQLRCVRKAVASMFDNVCDLKVRRNPLRMTIRKNDIEFEVDQLSDGEKCTLALLGDLARRLALANPGLENRLEGNGIVLIDEIELHMHPSWERKVLNVLEKTFPNVQFIVTTHSPQILNSADGKYNIIRMTFDEAKGENVAKYVGRMDGMSSNYILEEWMDTSSQNVFYRQWIDNAYKAIKSHDFDEAESILSEIIEVGGDNSVDAIEIEGAIRRERYLYEKNNKR